MTAATKAITTLIPSPTKKRYTAGFDDANKYIANIAFGNIAISDPTIADHMALTPNKAQTAVTTKAKTN
jgi:hypothetical protein